jgi:hypothetical protein
VNVAFSLNMISKLQAWERELETGFRTAAGGDKIKPPRFCVACCEARVYGRMRLCEKCRGERRREHVRKAVAKFRVRKAGRLVEHALPAGEKAGAHE